MNAARTGAVQRERRAARRPSQRTTTRHRSRLWEVLKCVEQITNDSNLVSVSSHHVSFIQTSRVDEQCITQKYKGKEKKKKILVLHYTFSKIYTE